MCKIKTFIDVEHLGPCKGNRHNTVNNLRNSPPFFMCPSCFFFTITADIHARSLVNFYGQYADRHMNLKFVRRVSEREREIRQFIIVKNKLMLVFNASVLLLTDAQKTDINLLN